MIGFPLDSHVTYDEHGVPTFDRAISSAPLRALLKQIMSDGVLPNPSTNMQVVHATSGMYVIVNPGFANVNGCMKLETATRELQVQASSNMYDRIDTVVLRLDVNDNARICDFYIKEGVPSNTPIAPELSRTESVYELGLANLFIAKNTSTVSAQRITDTRYDSNRCGIISAIAKFDTTTLYNQIQADLKNFQEINEAEFKDWFDNLVYVLDGDVAGHLQNEIDATKTEVSDLQNLVGDSADLPDASKSVAENVNAINSSLAKMEWVTVSSANPLVRYRKNGFLAEIFINTQNKQFAEDEVLATLPVGVRPDGLRRYYVGDNEHVTIHDDGKIDATSANGLSKYKVINGLYFI